ncbi:hypothetical protein R3W88_001374 [Solanum pinnatisectum]|uniref:Endonuclease/exonuclease/phosphatase domain-containing protein n=1 Tax=Solanum pinnatisectum TaxID=50273 RepID=A0AAV9MHZ3_9SOLN|nr:hypothetical protein R3W88_001374 [Solanum pinnatisectum]
MNALIWNIRSVRTQNAFQRVKMLHNHHKFAFVALFEPFQEVRHINKYRRRLRMPLGIHNSNGKIWLYINHGFDVSVMSNLDQQLTVLINNQYNALNFYATIVYTKPWFNVVLDGDKKIGGVLVDAADIDDFKTCIESCYLSQVPFKGSPFTWWNGRAGDDCIFERLDRILINAGMQNIFAQLEIDHLPRIGSDHAPMLLTCSDRGTNKKKPFRFLNFWTEHESFKEVVRLNWDSHISFNPFLEFKRNIKKIKKALTMWSRETYGDIFQQLIIREEIA